MTDFTASIDHCAPRRPSLLARLANMRSLARQRACLAKLDSARLADLGLTQAEARQEAARPAWDVPANWRA